MSVRVRFAAVLVVMVFGGGVVEAEDPTPIPLDLWTSKTDPVQVATVRYMADVFSLLNADVAVTVTAEEADQLPAALLAAELDGRSPDLLDASSELILGLAAEGRLDTSATTRLVEEIGENRFFRAPLRMVRAREGDQYLGLPLHAWIQGVWYRADWFAREKMPPPADWDTLLEAARRFTNPYRARYGILIGTENDDYATQVFTQLALSNDAAMFSRDGELVFNSPEMVETLAFYRDLAAYTPPGPQTRRARDYYLQGHMAIFFYSTFIMDDLALPEVAADSLTGNHFADLSGAPFDPALVAKTRMTPIIIRARDVGFGVLNSMGMFRQTDPRVRDAAMRFLRFLFETDTYVTWLHMVPGGLLPVLRDVAASDAFLHDPKGLIKRFGRDKMAEIIAGMEDIHSFAVVDGRAFPEAGQVFAAGIVPRMIGRTLREHMPPAEAVAQAEKEIRRLLLLD